VAGIGTRYLCFEISDEALYLDRAVPHEEKNVLYGQDLGEEKKNIYIYFHYTFL
jgi:hypothetical protein